MARPPSPRPELKDLLESALASRIGILLASPDPERLRAQLYSTRAASLDPRYSGLQLRRVDWPDGQLAIVNAAPASASKPPKGPRSPGLPDPSLVPEFG